MNGTWTDPADDAPHLLLVDDDRRIRELLSRFLAQEGYRVTTADSAAQARAKLHGLKFDLLILDVTMPGESGFDLAQAIRSESSVPILMLTARSEAGDRIRGLEIGADDFIFNLLRQELWRRDQIVHLTDRERELLTMLAEQPGETVTRLALAGSGKASNERAVDVQINRLRRKIEHDPTNPLIVQTVRGVGYRLMTTA
jgi:two-component system phosphate regulon response regulator OmpR